MPTVLVTSTFALGLHLGGFLSAPNHCHHGLLGTAWTSGYPLCCGFSHILVCDHITRRPYAKPHRVLQKLSNNDCLILGQFLEHLSQGCQKGSTLCPEDLFSGNFRVGSTVKIIESLFDISHKLTSLELMESICQLVRGISTLGF